MLAKKYKKRFTRPEACPVAGALFVRPSARCIEACCVLCNKFLRKRELLASRVQLLPPFIYGFNLAESVQGNA